MTEGRRRSKDGQRMEGGWCEECRRVSSVSVSDRHSNVVLRLTRTHEFVGIKLVDNLGPNPEDQGSNLRILEPISANEEVTQVVVRDGTVAIPKEKLELT